MSFSFHIAGPGDDAEIRALLARNPVPGRVAVSYEREPNFFLGCRAAGDFSQVIVARSDRTGELAAVACRAVRSLFLNGRPESVGYLSQLRVDDRFRGRWIVSGGFKYLRSLHEDGRAPGGYLATITREGNIARGILVDRPRPHFPSFERLADIATLAIAVGRERSDRGAGVSVSAATPDDVDEVSAFLGAVGRANQFFPVYGRDDFTNDGGSAPAIENFLLARRGGKLVGVLGLWDQSAFKQAVVRGYAPAFGRVVPFYNVLMKLRRRPGVPAVGERIRFVFASAVCVANADEAAFDALLARAYNRAASGDYDYLMVGLAARDPFLKTARSYAHIEYKSALYGVRWKEAEGYRERLDDRMPYVEIATL